MVRCNCFREGKTSPPPVARDLIVVDEDGFFYLDVPYDENEDLHAAFDSWLEGACVHPRMEYASVWVANWFGYGEFRALLKNLGWEHFSTLQGELPLANGGTMPSDSAHKCLAELEYLRQQSDVGVVTVLVDSDTGEDVEKYFPGSSPFFHWDDHPGVKLGLDDGGFFIVPSHDDAIKAAMDDTFPARKGRAGTASEPMELFRSLRFEQWLLEPELTMDYKHGRVQYVDLDSGVRFVCRSAVAGRQVPWPDGRMQDDKGRVRREYPRRMHVITRRASLSSFEHIIEALETVCQASVETGNPVVWC
jgi:hypothetical protein